MPDRKTVVQAKFRLRNELLDKLRESAQAADRSLNEEVERRLEASFPGEGRLDVSRNSMITREVLKSVRALLRDALDDVEDALSVD